MNSGKELTRSMPGAFSSVVAAFAVILMFVAGAAAQEPDPYAPGPDSGYGQAPADQSQPPAADNSAEPGTVETQGAASQPAAEGGAGQEPAEKGPAEDGAVGKPEEGAPAAGQVEEPQEEGGKEDGKEGGKKESAVDKEAKKLKPFEGAYLLYGRNVKVPTASRRFAVGIDLAVAPLNVVAKVAKDKFTDMAMDQVCGNATDQTQCRQTIESAVDVLSSVSDSEWQSIRDAAGGDRTALMQALESAGVADPTVRDSIAEVVYSYADQYVGDDQRVQAVDAIRAGATTSAMNLLFNPYLYMNFKWIEATVYAPFAVRVGDGANGIDMANVGVDLKSGGDWTFGKVASIGLAGGIELTMPSGTSGISQSRGSDVFAMPKYTYGMLTWAPYLVFGVELAHIIQLQGHVELVSMHGVLDGAEFDHSMYLKYGGGFILLPRFLMSILFELNGCKGLKDFSRDDVLMVGAGLNFRAKYFKIFMGVQVPLLDQGNYVWDAGYWSGANYAQLSKFNVMSRIGFEF